MNYFPWFLWSPMPKKKEQNTTNITALFDCRRTGVPVCTESQKSRPTATPLKHARRQEDSPFPEGTGQREELTAASALYVCIQRAAWSIGKNVRVCGSELQVVAGVSARLHQSVESTQERPQLKKSPHPTSCAPRSFSHKHAFSISSRSICTYSSSPCRVPRKPIRWIRPL